MPVALTLSSPTISITVPAAGNSTSSVPDNIDAAIQALDYVTFPVPWAPLSGKPNLRLTLTNNSLTCSVAVCLVDRYASPALGQTRSSIWIEPWTVQPAETIVVAIKGIPKTRMDLVGWFISADDSDLGRTFTIGVLAENV